MRIIIVTMKHAYLLFTVITMVTSCSPYRKFSRHDPKEERKKFAQTFADSINQIKSLGMPPQFLQDPCFDYHYNRYWQNMHQALSLRKIVIDRVNNRNALEYILSLNDSAANGICVRQKDTMGLTYVHVPYADKSFTQLMKDRISELQK